MMAKSVLPVQRNSFAGSMKKLCKTFNKFTSFLMAKFCVNHMVIVFSAPFNYVLQFPFLEFTGIGNVP